MVSGLNPEQKEIVKQKILELLKEHGKLSSGGVLLLLKKNPPKHKKELFGRTVRIVARLLTELKMEGKVTGSLVRKSNFRGFIWEIKENDS